MSLEDAFLDDIRRAPDDDAVRLVYAAWLKDTGQPLRAEFIRVQLELARSQGAEARRPRRRCDDLVAAHGDDWLSLTELQGVGVKYPRVRRGFVDSAAVEARTFLAQAEMLFELAPLLREVRLGEAVPVLPRLAACEHLGRLT